MARAAQPVEPIVRRKLSDDIFDRLRDMISSGSLSPGDPMPSERDLMERFGVGRPAVREALQSLETKGLITISHSERSRVKELTAGDAFQQMDEIAQSFVQADIDFHARIAKITANPLIVAVSETMLKWLFQYHTSILQWSGHEETTLREHEEIVHFLEKSDAIGAVKMMEKHLNRSEPLYSHPI